MSRLHFVLRPTVYLESDGSIKLEPPFGEELKEAVEEKIFDGKIIRDMFYGYRIPYASYQDDRINIWIERLDGRPFGESELSEIYYNISPNHRGPDTWMLQGIEIFEDEDALRELVPIVEAVYDQNENLIFVPHES